MQLSYFTQDSIITALRKLPALLWIIIWWWLGKEPLSDWGWQIYFMSYTPLAWDLACPSIQTAVHLSICPPITLSKCPHISRQRAQGIYLKHVEYIHHGTQQIWLVFGHALLHSGHFLASDLSTRGQSAAYAVVTSIVYLVKTSRMVIISYAWLHLDYLGNRTSGVKWGKLPTKNS